MSGHHNLPWVLTAGGLKLKVIFVYSITETGYMKPSSLGPLNKDF